MKKIINNKSAAIGTTLTWIVALFIIFFLLIIFLFIVFAMSLPKFWSFNPENEISVVNGLNPDPATIESTFSVLNSPVTIDSKSQRAEDAILSVFELYFDTKNSDSVSLVDKYGLYNYDDITRTTKTTFLKDGFNEIEINNIDSKKQELFNELKKQLDNYCDSYKFGTPFGNIEYNADSFGSSDSMGNMVYFNLFKDPTDWSKVIEIKRSYRGKEIKFQLIMTKKCSNINTNPNV